MQIFEACREYDELKLRRDKEKENRKKQVLSLIFSVCLDRFYWYWSKKLSFYWRILPHKDAQTQLEEKSTFIEGKMSLKQSRLRFLTFSIFLGWKSIEKRSKEKVMNVPLQTSADSSSFLSHFSLRLRCYYLSWTCQLLPRDWTPVVERETGLIIFLANFISEVCQGLIAY